MGNYFILLITALLGGNGHHAEHPFVEIARLISLDNVKVVRDVKACVSNPKSYFKRHDEYWLRGIEEWGEESEDVICWLGMVDALQRQEYVDETDWKGEIYNVLGGLQKVARKSGFDIVMGDLPLQVDLNQTVAIEPVLYEISKLLAEKGIVLGVIDIESDSYALFLTRPHQKQKLIELAQSAGHQIEFEFAKELDFSGVL